MIQDTIQRHMRLMMTIALSTLRVRVDRVEYHAGPSPTDEVTAMECLHISNVSNFVARHAMQHASCLGCVFPANHFLIDAGDVIFRLVERPALERVQHPC